MVCSETFTAAIDFANYGPQSLPNATLAWRLSAGEKTIGQGTLPQRTLPDQGLTSVGNISLPLSSVLTARPHSFPEK